MYNSVQVTQLRNRNAKEYLSTLTDYNKYLKKYIDVPIAENVGLENQQVKPYFDIDAFNNDIDILSVKNDIQKLFPNKPIYYAKREPRETKKGLKFSYRFYVGKTRISSHNIKKLIISNGLNNNSIYDLSVYDKNKLLFLPNTTLKDFDIVVPKLVPIDCDVFDCCASYIKEEYEDWDVKIKDEKLDVKLDIKLFDEITPKYDGDLNFLEILINLSKERATEYNSWFYVIVALINLYHRKIISSGQIFLLADTFSLKADNYDGDGVVKVIDTNISRFDGKGYGIKYLLECLKIDNIEYYKKITKKDLLIDGANDDIGAAEIVVNHYKEELIICKGILYVNDNDVWICNEKQVDKLLIDMIGKLEILFYGADGKRKYHYNKSIKHIKDCIICIKANKTIINDKFYDEMIKNNKYYLPFHDGIIHSKKRNYINIRNCLIFILHIK